MMMMKILNQYTTHSSAETSFLLVVYSIAAESRKYLSLNVGCYSCSLPKG